jgi:hypothetical protein
MSFPLEYLLSFPRWIVGRDLGFVFKGLSSQIEFCVISSDTFRVGTRGRAVAQGRARLVSAGLARDRKRARQVWAGRDHLPIEEPSSSDPAATEAHC